MIGRFVVGVAVAVSGIADVAYLHEISSVWDDDACEVNPNSISDTAGLETASDSTGEERSHNKGSGGRGSVVSVNEACISLGFLVAYGLAYALGNGSQNSSDSVDENWRNMFAFGGLLAALQFAGMLCMPESPVWLHGKGRLQDAISARNKIRGFGASSNDRRRSSMGTSSQHSQNQLGRNQSQSTGIEMSAPPSSPGSHSSPLAVGEQIQTSSSRFIDCFLYSFIKIRSAPSRMKAKYHQLVQVNFSPHKKQWLIVLFLAASQQFCGHPSVLSFSTEIFGMLRGDQVGQGSEKDANGSINAIELLTVGVGLLKFLTTCVVIVCLERGGRRGWLLSGMGIIASSLAFLSIAFVGHNAGDIGSENLQHDSSSSFKNDLGIAGIYGVAIGYAASYGPLTWLITSELFPSSIRGRALGFATITTYMAAGLVSRTFLSLQTAVGLPFCFALYLTATVSSFVFVWLAVPDTGGERTPEEIDKEMDQFWIWGLFHIKASTTTRDSWTPVGSYGTTSSPVSHSGLNSRRQNSGNFKEIT
ncbi:hypothetical protein ACHAWF_003520 [Thalassiosira exigua]